MPTATSIAPPPVVTDAVPPLAHGSVASRLAHHGIPGLLDMASRLIKVLANYPAHREWLQVLEQPTTLPLLQSCPRLVYRYTLPCLSSVLPWDRRLAMLKGHYQYVNRHFTADLFARLLDDRVPLWSTQIDDTPIQITLSGPCMITLHREGELCLNFKMGTFNLCKLAFSIIPGNTMPWADASSRAEDEHLVFIGQVQGAPAAFDQIRLATSRCGDIAPQDLLMSALAGLCRALGIHQALGVATEHNISYDQLSQPGPGFDYNRFWTRYDSSEHPEGHHLIAVPYAEKPLQLVAAKHRSRNRAKRAFKADVLEAVAHAFSAQLSTMRA